VKTEFVLSVFSFFHHKLARPKCIMQ